MKKMKTYKIITLDSISINNTSGSIMNVKFDKVTEVELSILKEDIKKIDDLVKDRGFDSYTLYDIYSKFRSRNFRDLYNAFFDSFDTLNDIVILEEFNL
jgi:hypothetical protein